MDLRNPSQSPLDKVSQQYDEATVSELLKTKRKARAIKSCFPCRHRKVRCDGRIPCSNCVQRDHASLCRTQAGPGKQESSSPVGQVGPGAAAGAAAGSAALSDLSGIVAPAVPSHALLENGDFDPNLMLRRLERIEEQISGLKTDFVHQVQAKANGAQAKIHQRTASSSTPGSEPDGLPAKGKHFVERTTGATIFLGNQSEPPSVLGVLNPFHHNVIPDQLAPRAYAFANLWAPDIGTEEICKTLPGDSDIIRYWQIYQTLVYPFYPALVTLDDFNISLFSFLDRENKEARARDIDPSWLSLLFAVIGCGAQFSDDATEQRDLRSKVFVCSSFQCLRTSNLLNNTDMNTIQAMALIGHCLRNNLDTNSAWIIMGLTIRLAQSMGLHEEPSEETPPVPSSRSEQRRRLWSMLLWQDAFLSVTYGRTPSTTTMASGIPNEYIPGVGHTFADSVFKTLQIILDHSRQEGLGDYQAFLDHKRRFDDIKHDAAPFLVDKALCKTLQEHLERLAFTIHVGYGLCRIYRMCLERDECVIESSVRDALTLEYGAYAIKVVQAFLDMYRLSANVCRSWAFVHNVVTSAVVLKQLSVASPQVFEAHAAEYESCIGRLIQMLEKEEKNSKWTDADTNVRHFGPYSRALEALRDAFPAQ